MLPVILTVVTKDKTIYHNIILWKQKCEKTEKDTLSNCHLNYEILYQLAHGYPWQTGADLTT